MENEKIHLNTDQKDAGLVPSKYAKYQTWHFILHWIISANNMCIRYNLVPIQAELSKQLGIDEIKFGILVSVFFLTFNFFSFAFGI